LLAARPAIWVGSGAASPDARRAPAAGFHDFDATEHTHRRYVACTASAQPASLHAAHRESWTWSRELFGTVAARSNVAPASVIEQVERLLDGAPSRWRTR
jgi:hypothetical protein